MTTEIIKIDVPDETHKPETLQEFDDRCFKRTGLHIEQVPDIDPDAVNGTLLIRSQWGRVWSYPDPDAAADGLWMVVGMERSHDDTPPAKKGANGFMNPRFYANPPAGLYPIRDDSDDEDEHGDLDHDDDPAHLHPGDEG